MSDDSPEDKIKKMLMSIRSEALSTLEKGSVISDEVCIITRKNKELTAKLDRARYWFEEFKGLTVGETGTYPSNKVYAQSKRALDELNK